MKARYKLGEGNNIENNTETNIAFVFDMQAAFDT